MQLHELVDAVTADEPPMVRTADDIVAAGRRTERRRRAGFASAGAAGLVAVAVAGAFALLSFGGGAEQTSPSVPVAVGSAPGTGSARWPTAQPFTFTFRGFDAGIFHVQDPIVASTAYQISSVYAEGHISNDKPDSSLAPEPTRSRLEQKKAAAKGPPTLHAYLTVYRPGAFDPLRLKGGKALTVAGHKAVQATLPVGLEEKNPPQPGNKSLAWEYTDDAWAVVTSISSSPDSPSFADLGALVTGLKPSKARPAMLPFTVGHVPDGYQPVQTGTHAMPGLDGIATARGGDFGGATYARPAPATTGLTAPFDATGAGVPHSFSISVTPSTNSNQPAQAGRSKCYPSGFCNVWSADGAVQVQVSAQIGGADLPASELIRIARSIKVADVDDEATWTPAAEALRQ